MTVKEIKGKWHTVSKTGKVGKRGFSTKANAEAAQARGQALLGRTSTQVDGSGSPGDSIVPENPDTADERRALGIPLKAEPRGEF